MGSLAQISTSIPPKDVSEGLKVVPVGRHAIIVNPAMAKRSGKAGRRKFS
jgi:hypothetical protein